jgi:hypothetical protein
MTINLIDLQPIVALIAGLLILMIPRLLHVVVGAYLIIVGVLGLLPHFLPHLTRWGADIKGGHAVGVAAIGAWAGNGSGRRQVARLSGWSPPVQFYTATALFQAVEITASIRPEGGFVNDVSFEDFKRLVKSHEELSGQVIALTALIGAMATTASIDFERLEDCVQFAAKRLSPSRRPVLFAKAALILEDFDAMQKALRTETRKIRSRRTRAARR